MLAGSLVTGQHFAFEAAIQSSLTATTLCAAQVDRVSQLSSVMGALTWLEICPDTCGPISVAKHLQYS